MQFGAQLRLLEAVLAAALLLLDVLPVWLPLPEAVPTRLPHYFQQAAPP